MEYQPPAGGESISMKDGQLSVPDHPIVPYIEGDGTGPDIWASAQRVLDAAVEKAYGGAPKVAWEGGLGGEKTFYATNLLVAGGTLEGLRTYPGGIKGPTPPPVGGGI